MKKGFFILALDPLFEEVADAIGFAILPPVISYDLSCGLVDLFDL